MARGSLILCVLIQILLITTVYGNVNVTCPSQNGTVGKTLHLTCIVACERCTLTQVVWKKADNCVKKVDCNITVGKNHTFNCEIENTSMEYNETFTFWAQMTTGIIDKSFTVNIVSVPDNSINEETYSVKNPAENSRSPTVALAVIVTLCLVLSIVVGVLLKRKKDNNMSTSAPCTCKMIPETTII